jgi:hypothetical protein
MRSLESIAGWRTERKVRGKLVLGKVSGISAGLRACAGSHETIGMECANEVAQNASSHDRW